MKKYLIVYRAYRTDIHNPTEKDTYVTSQIIAFDITEDHMGIEAVKQLIQNVTPYQIKFSQIIDIVEI